MKTLIILVIGICIGAYACGGCDVKVQESHAPSKKAESAHKITRGTYL